MESETYVSPVDEALSEHLAEVGEDDFPPIDPKEVAEAKKRAGSVDDEQFPEEPGDPFAESDEDEPEAAKGDEASKKSAKNEASDEEVEKKPEEPVTAYGSESEPYTVDDFGEDEFVRVKIDGEEQIVSVREAIDSGLRRATFDRRANRLKLIQRETETFVKESQTQLRQWQKGFFDTVGDSEKLMAFLEDHHPDVLDEITLAHHPALWEAHEKGNLETWRQQRKLRVRERLLEQQHKRAEQEQLTQKQRQRLEARRAVVGPALRAALAETGFERPSRELLGEIASALDAKESRLGRELTGEEITAIAAKWMRAEMPNGSGKKRERKQRGGQRRTPRADRSTKPTPARRNGEVQKYNEFGEISVDFLMGG